MIMNVNLRELWWMIEIEIPVQQNEGRMDDNELWDESQGCTCYSRIYI